MISKPVQFDFPYIVDADGKRWATTSSSEFGNEIAAALNSDTQSRIEVLETALGIYALKENWYGREQENMWDIYWTGSTADGYDIARDALAESKRIAEENK